MVKTKESLKRILTIESALYELSIMQRILGFFGLSERGIIWKYQRRLRIYEYHLNNRHAVRASIYHILVNKMGFKYGFIIEPNSVDEGMRICHLGSIVIRGKIGKNATIHINTALVGGGTINKAPNCGDNLYLSIGSTVVGPVTVGNNVCIAAGAVVTHNVPDNVTVGGVPEHVLNKRGPLDW